MLRRSYSFFSDASAAAIKRNRLFSRMATPEEQQSKTSKNTTSPFASTPFASSPLKNGGRCFEMEDRQSGMLFTLTDIENIQQKHMLWESNNNNSTSSSSDKGKTNSKAMKERNQMVFVGDNATQSSFRRLGAVVKGQSSDWQVNEIYSTAPSPTSSFNNNNEGNQQQRNYFYLSLGALRPFESAAQDDDTNTTALNSFFASVVNVTKTPKGAWKKIAPAHKKKIETDQSVAFSDPNKHFREVLVTHGAYAMKKGIIPVDRNVLEFSLYRENTPFKALTRRIAKRLRIQDEKLERQQSEDFFVVSSKESYGCVNQMGRIRNVSSEMLPHASRHYNINPILFNPLRYLPSENTMMMMSSSNNNNNNDYGDDDSSSSSSSSLLSASFSGNRWRVMLRCVDGTKAEIESNLSRIAQKGAINYFPLRNLGGGSAGGTAAEISSAVANGNYFDACRFWLQNEGSKDFLFKPHYSAYMTADEGAVGGVLNIASNELQDAKASPYLVKTTRFLSDFYQKKRHNNNSSKELSDEICKTLWDDVVSRAVDNIAMREAPDNFLWNLAVSQRLYKHGSDRVVKGDYVLLPSSSESSSKNKSTFTKQIESDEEGKKYQVDKHLVVPFASNFIIGSEDEEALLSNCWYREFYKSAREQFGLENEKCFSSDGGSSHHHHQFKKFRKVIVKPWIPMEALVIQDPNSLSVLKTDLFLRQERKNANSDVTLEERFRKPTLLNASDAFRELMQDSIHNPPPSSEKSFSSSLMRNNNKNDQKSRCSVAIEVDLPAGSHILSFLREAFLLRHIHYTDQMDIASAY